MIDKMVTNFFTKGFSDTESTFEKYIVNCLKFIFGEKIIEEIKESNNIEILQEYIDQKYKDPKLYESFIKDIMNYEKECSNSNSISLPNIKGAIISDIINMYVYLNITKELSLEEIKSFEELLYSIKIPKQTKEYWKQKKILIQNEITLVEIKPVLLPEKRYEQAGLKIDDVKKMDSRMIKKLNDYIESKIPEPKKQSNLVLDSGSGFVNILLISSIIVTEISVGLIYFLLRK